MSQKPLLLKMLVVGALALVLLVPLAMVQGLVAERAALKHEVVRSVAQSAAGTQRVTLPVLVVPYVHKWVETVESLDEQGRKRTVRHERSTAGAARLLPEAVAVRSAPQLAHKYRGLYRVLTYTAHLAVSGRFAIPKDFGLAPVEGRVEWGTPVFALGISDPRGIRNGPILDWGGARITMQPGAGGDLTRLGQGISAAVPGSGAAGASAVDFKVDIELAGMERISFVPTGRETRVTLAAAWPHPSFFGKFSPEKTIGPGDFSAEWKTSFFSTNAAQAYAVCGASGKCEAFEANEFGLSFIQPADLYQQLERSAKYGFLFIGLTFAAFFLFETLKALAVHPVQYGLVGLALALFFVLLVSLSEHIGFASAYAAAASACVGLIVVYAGAVLRSWGRASAIGAQLAALYGVLYMLLRSEDYALLMGSLFLFGLLAATMLGTRRVDWYALHATPREPKPETVA